MTKTYEQLRDSAAVEYRKDREWIKCEDASYETDFKAGADWRMSGRKRWWRR